MYNVRVVAKDGEIIAYPDIEYIGVEHGTLTMVSAKDSNVLWILAPGEWYGAGKYKVAE